MTHWLLPVDTTSMYDFARRGTGLPPQFLYPTYLPLAARVGDQVLFWRSAFGSGIVTLGAIVDQVPIETLASARRRALNRDDDPPEYSHVCGRIEHHTFNLSSPISADYLRAAGLNTLVAQSRKLTHPGGDSLNAVGLELTAEEWDQVNCLAKSAPPLNEWPTAWDLVPGDVIEHRRQVHYVYGGNRVRVAASGQTPNILVFNRFDADSRIDGPGFYSGKIVHGGGANTTDKTRQAININYCIGWVRQEENQYLSVPMEVARTFP